MAMSQRAGNDLLSTLPELRHALEKAADPERAPGMAAYMKDNFEFLGVTSPHRRAAAKPVLGAGKGCEGDELLSFAEACWQQPEREFHYVGMDLLRKWAAVLAPEHLGRIETLIRTNSWWDTIDSLAPWTVGAMVTNHPELTDAMDDWIEDSNIWIARTAILHQLSYKERCNQLRLFGYVDIRSGDTEFFIRKALGWALRQHARVEPEAVRTFVADRGAALSGLTRREALKHLDVAN
ncbi:MAG: 3-methyladenine DNA glycosylase AlkD [Acidimicrobiales bacterium]|jgi:3-methyladenine DNA glycosylase AlkD